LKTKAETKAKTKIKIDKRYQDGGAIAKFQSEKILYDEDGFWLVPSQTDSTKYYKVSHTYHKGFHCDCMDFVVAIGRKKFDHKCKHILAVIRKEKKRNENENEDEKH
jgi:hypothetical protein